MSKIGLVTVLYKSDDVLDGFFRSIARQSHKDYILYLVDNSVSEKSDQVIAKCLTDYPITAYQHIKNSENIGVAAGNNAGIQLSLHDGCSHVLLLNNDIEFEQDNVFSTMLELSRNGETMIVPKIFYYTEPRLWMAGGYMNKWRAIGVHYGMGEKDAPKYNIAKYISYAPTCFMLIGKKVFEKTGFVDEQYFAYYDDTDFILRATRNGFRLYYEPSISILHKVSTSTGGNSPFYVYYSNRNKIYFIRKNLHGIQRTYAILHTYLTRFFYYLKFDKEKRKKLLQGLRDGWNLKIVK